jgi:epoxyqueuosine reductase
LPDSGPLWIIIDKGKKDVIENRLKEWAAARGYGLALAGTGIIEEARNKIAGLKTTGLIDPGFFEGNLGGFRYLSGSAIAGPKRLIMVAVPRPIHTLPVTIDGRRIDGLLPPTYVEYRKTFETVLADLKEHALAGRLPVEILQAPLKTLAVRMGFVVYGRNNITYAAGLGSGYQLCGYLLGTGPGPAAEEEPAEDREKTLKRCARCRACVRACPTGAIREDRFLISAERCYTLFSESRKPLPAGIRPPKPLCLIGCLICQQVCPENKGRLKTAPSGIEFSAEETEAVRGAGRRLAAGRGPAAEKRGGALASARAKFAALGLTEDLEVVGRNLDFFLRLPQNGRP